MKKVYLSEYCGLDGVRGGRLKGPMVSSINGVMTALKKHRVVSDAGDRGAVMVWRDDANQYRCTFCRWRVVVDKQIFRTRAAVLAWLKEWFLQQRIER